MKSGNKRAINIAGGSADGDCYQTTSEQRNDPFEEAATLVSQLSLPAAEKDNLQKVILDIQTESGKGNSANSGIVDYLLSGVKVSAPLLLPWISRGILQRATSSAMRRLAQQAAEATEPLA